jgi:hypothetical protein
LCRWKIADARRGSGAISIEKDFLLQALARELHFLHAAHVRLNERGERAAFSDLLFLAAEAFVLIGQAGEECFDELHLAVRQLKFGIGGIELERMARLTMTLEIYGLVICAGGIALMTIRALKMRAIQRDDCVREMQLMIEAQRIRVAQAGGENFEFRMVLAKPVHEAGEHGARRVGFGDAPDAARMLQKVIAIAVAARTLTRGVLLQTGFALVFGVAAQAGNLFSDASRMMKVVSSVAFAAGAIHASEGNGMSPESGEAQISRTRARGSFDPALKSGDGGTMAGAAILFADSGRVFNAAARLAVHG